MSAALEPAPGLRSGLRGISLRGLVASAIVVLMVAILATAVGTVLVRHRIDTIRNQSRTELRPAQQLADQLTTAYVEQETGERGYLLTGFSTYLQAYRNSEQTAAGYEAELARLLADYPSAIDRLDAIAAVGPQWQKAAQREITARTQGPLTSDELVLAARQSQPLFARLRSDLDALTIEISQLLGQLIVRFDAAQRLADIATIAAVAFAVITAVVCLLAIRRLFTRPLAQLMGSMREVAGGAYEQPIPTNGSGEIALIAEAVEGMRQNIVTSTRALLAARDELTLRDERARMAADLHDLTLQDVFALGLRIDGLMATSPALADRLRPLLDDIANIDRELRTIVYANTATPTEGTLRARIATVTHDSRRSLGFGPVLQLDGPLDTVNGQPAEDLLAALREVLSNIARHAHATEATVTVTRSDEPEPVVRLHVADNGIGLPAAPVPGNGLRNLAARAATHGGTVTTTSSPGNGTTIDWRICVPISTDEASTDLSGDRDVHPVGGPPRR